MKNDHPNGQPTASSRSAIAEPPAISESLRHFRNQSPSESLGLPTGNNLGKPFLQATIITAVLFALLTVGPYFLDKGKSAEAKANAPSADKQEPAEPAKTPPATSPEALPKNPQANAKAPSKGDIIDKLGENSKKTAPTSVNPLDKKDDDILKDIK